VSTRVALRFPVPGIERWAALSAILLAGALLTPAMHWLAEANMLAHHLQHLLLLAAGATLASSVAPGFHLGRTAYAAAAAGLGLVVFWHIPIFFDAGVTNDSLHILVHASFLSSGALLGLSLRGLGEVGRGLLLVFAVAAMPLWSFAGLAGLFTAYPASQQAVAGTVMFLVDAAIWVGYVWWPKLRPVMQDWRLTVAIAVGATIVGGVSLA
jgi:cytochrome c oxidase assembly factor CtaG